MADELTARIAGIADADAIARIYVDAWRSAYAGIVPDRVLVRMSVAGQAREWTRALSRRATAERIMVAEQPDGGIIGFGSMGEARSPGLPHAGEIFTLYVAPEHQEQGVGRMLLYRLFDGLIDSGLNSALVWVLADNPARFFYEAMGGRRVGEKHRRLWNADLPQAAYGWNDLRIVPRRGGLRAG
jgi:ribosomal protein S18 acetylase RimI-like enzyme